MGKYDGATCEYCTGVIPTPAPYSLPLCSSECFHNEFWMNKVRMKEYGDKTAEGYKVVRIEGSHYSIAPDNQSNHGFKGFGGRKFTIEFIDGPHKGQIVETQNLWHNGTIPEDWKPQLPDNAKWVVQKRESRGLDDVLDFS